VWTLEALKQDYEVTLISTNELPIEEVNQYYGTSLKPKDFQSVVVHLPLGFHNKSRFWYLRRLMLMRHCQKMAREYDLCISTYYEMDFGRRGIQYVHSPAVAVGIAEGLDSFLDQRQQSTIKKAYRKLVAQIFDFSVNTIRQNLTLVNSKWTGQLIKRAYGIDPIVVYPPVSIKFRPIPWNTREDGFVCIGRIARSKRIDMVIRILQRVRELGWNIHLHVIGKGWDASYVKKLEAIQRKNSDWVFLEGQVSRERLGEFIARHKYGIHGMRNEHFGIAVAEMVKAGNIVFVPNDGGQVEIVNDWRLTYNSEEEAVERIVSVLSSQQAQIDIRKRLEERAQTFSTSHFIKQMQEIVQHELEDKD